MRPRCGAHGTRHCAHGTACNGLRPLYAAPCPAHYTPDSARGTECNKLCPLYAALRVLYSTLCPVDCAHSGYRVPWTAPIVRRMVPRPLYAALCPWYRVQGTQHRADARPHSEVHPGPLGAHTGARTPRGGASFDTPGDSRLAILATGAVGGQTREEWRSNACQAWYAYREVAPWGEIMIAVKYWSSGSGQMLVKRGTCTAR